MSSAVFTIAAALQGFSVLFVMNHAAHDQAHNDYQNCSYNKCSHIDPPLSAELLCLYSTLYVYVQSLALLVRTEQQLSLIHISEPTRQAEISYAVFCLKKKDLSLIHISEPTRQAEISYAVFCLKKKTIYVE